MDEKRRIYDLSDEDLVREIAVLDVALLPPTQLTGMNEKPPLTDWESSFLSGVQTAWVQYASLTWKQRKQARLLLLKVSEYRVRLQDLNDLRMSAASR